MYFRSLKDHPKWQEASKAIIGQVDPDIITMIQEIFPPIYPPADVYLTDKEVIVLVGIQGWSQKDEIIISPVNGGLEVKGVKYTLEPADVNAFCASQEIFRGNFCRTIEIPCEVDADDFSVKYTNGLMEIRLRQLQDEIRGR